MRWQSVGTWEVACMSAVACKWDGFAVGVVCSVVNGESVADYWSALEAARMTVGCVGGAAGIFCRSCRHDRCGGTTRTNRRICL